MKRNIDFKTKIKERIRNEEQEKRKKWEEFFTPSKKNFEFPKKEVNMVKHFYFPKFLIPDQEPENSDSEFIFTGGVYKEGLAIYPVLCSIADFQKDEWFHIPVEQIAKMAGLTKAGVKKGILQLKSMKLLQQKKLTEGKVHFYKYQVYFIREPEIKFAKSEYFIFHTAIIDSGLWSKLTLRAKALYCAMRTVAKFNPAFYQEVMDIDYEEFKGIFHENFKDRLFDVCQMSITELCKMVGISRFKIEPVIQELEKAQLINKIKDGVFIVYLKPEKFLSDINIDIPNSETLEYYPPL